MGHQRQQQRIRSRGARYRVRHATTRSERGLKLAYFVAVKKTSLVTNTRHRLLDFVSNQPVLPIDI